MQSAHGSLEWKYSEPSDIRTGWHPGGGDRDITLGEPLEGVAVMRDENIRFGGSYKYNRGERAELFALAGLDDVGSWSGKDCDVAFYQLKLRGG